MTIREIRELLGASRTEFSRRYKIPLRTLEHWDACDRQPPEWLPGILEKAVRFDLNGHESGHVEQGTQ